jgi:hypothetical protein
MLKVQQAKINELKKRIGGNSEVLAEWQTASLVICGVLSPISHTFLA